MSGDHPIAYSIPAEGLKLDIALVETKRLLLHEETIPVSLERLMGEISTDGVLRDPVIVDRESLVVLDGMHRVSALSSLGCRFTCACLVEYDNPMIKLDRWCRALKGPIPLEDYMMKARELEATVVPSSQGDDEDGEGVSLNSEEGSYKIVPQQSGVFSAFETVAGIDSWLMERGLEVYYETERDAMEKLSNGEVASVLCPPRIEKRHIIDIAEAGKVFTFKATRHIVPARPIGVDVPMDLLRDRDVSVEEANGMLSELLEAKALRRIPPGMVWSGRRYDEALYVFEDR